MYFYLLHNFFNIFSALYWIVKVVKVSFTSATYNLEVLLTCYYISNDNILEFKQLINQFMDEKIHYFTKTRQTLEGFSYFNVIFYVLNLYNLYCDLLIDQD